MHWADVVAGKLTDRRNAHRVATGITPSGEIHLGNMREILTGDIIARAVRSTGLQGELVFIADTFDPLRKVYPFLDDSYHEHVSRPLSQIPCVCGSHDNYAEHFLEPFLIAVDELGIEHTTVRVHDMYRDGRYADVVKRILDSREKVRDILSMLSGRQLDDDWWPYSINCSSCGKQGKASVQSYDWPYLAYLCSCGYEGKADVRTDSGKLPWRLEWPARWFHLGITCEPFGKDHATKGGSYDTGSRIMEEVLQGQPPFPVIYEWIQLKGKGAMSSSKGVVVTAVDMLSMTPPEVMRFLIARSQPNKHLDFDPGFGLLSLVDEYDRLEQNILEEQDEDEKYQDMKRTYELSQPDVVPEKNPVSVPYRHFVSLVQIARDWEGVKEIILRDMPQKELTTEDEEHLRHRDLSARFWLERFAPEEVKFSLLEKTPAVNMSDEERDAMVLMVKNLKKSDWDAESIHETIHESAKESGVSAGALFKLGYTSLIGKNRGPRMGFFLSSLSREWVLERLENCTMKE